MLLFDHLLCQALADKFFKIELQRVGAACKLRLLFDQICEHVLCRVLLISVSSLELPLQKVICCAVALTLVAAVQLVRG